MRTRHLPCGFEKLESRHMLTSVEIPAGTSGRPGDEVVVSVEVDDVHGIRAAEIHIDYDAELLEAESSGVLAGSAWSGRAAAVAKVDAEHGSIAVFLYSARPLVGDHGSLVDIYFTIRQNARGGDAAEVDVVKVRLNEGAIPLSEQPAPGSDPSDGLVMVAARATDPVTENSLPTVSALPSSPDGFIGPLPALVTTPPIGAPASPGKDPLGAAPRVEPVAGPRPVESPAPPAGTGIGPMGPLPAPDYLDRYYAYLESLATQHDPCLPFEASDLL